MQWTVFTEMVRRHWRGVFYWGGGLGLLGFYMVLFSADANILEQYVGLIEALPPEFGAALGVQDIEILTTPEGFISFGYFTYGVLIVAVYGLLSGMNVTANDEDDGIMDVMLALPIPRSRIMLEKFFVYALFIVLMVVVSWVAVAIGIVIASSEANLGTMFIAAMGMVPLGLVTLTVAALLGVIFRRKFLALGAASAFVAMSFVFKLIGDAVNHAIADIMGAVSFFSYFQPNEILTEGLVISHIIILLVVALLGAVGSLYLWERRDVGI